MREAVIYLKGALAGLLALIAVAVCFLFVVVVGTLIYNRVYPPSGEGSIGWDLISLVRLNPVTCFIPVLIFVTGFAWEYRRLTE